MFLECQDLESSMRSEKTKQPQKRNKSYLVVIEPISVLVKRDSGALGRYERYTRLI